MRYAVNWHTSPSCARILERLECKGRGTPEAIAADVFCAEVTARNMLKLMKSAGVIHVAARIRQARGLAKPLYALGPGVNVDPPKKEPSAQRYKRRRAALINAYGVEVTNKVLNAKAHGRPVVVVDGKRVTSASARYGVAGQVVMA